VTDRDEHTSFTVTADGDGIVLHLKGDWTSAAAPPGAAALRDACQSQSSPSGDWRVSSAADFRWDSTVASRLFALALYCDRQDIAFDTSALPDNLQKLLGLATAVKQPPAPPAPPPGLAAQLKAAMHSVQDSAVEFLAFLGAVVLALGATLLGRSQARMRDLLYFIEQCGPKAIGIVALISVLVGMILAYLGAVQLSNFGAEVYVANLVALGMVREMGPLMTAVIMAGRTGAAYAAQLGTMQSNEEIDAITTLGLSPVEYLVVPRLLALVLVMPLLVIFANIIGLAGGGLVAAGMDVNIAQFIDQARSSVTLGDIATGLFKSLVFAGLIAIAGCQAGLASGRTSAAVGNATTRAVVHAIVYLVVADALLNIIYNLLGV